MTYHFEKTDLLVKNIPIFLAVFFLMFSAQAFAQVGSNTNIVVNPSSPQPNELFSVNLTSSDVDLERSNIKWYLNGAKALEGVGESGFTSRTGGVGTYFDIRVDVFGPNGAIITKNAFVQPQEVNLIWRAHTYTPPFYKGLSLPSSSSYVVITAMPEFVSRNGDKINSEDLLYTWSQNGFVLGNASGHGKQTIVLENGQIQKSLLNISVVVSTINNSISSKKDFKMPIFEPEIIFYEVNPLDGPLYSNALSEPVIGDGDFTVRAEPFYFSTDDFSNDKLLYKWEINNTSINTKDYNRPNEIVFRSDGKKGVASVSLNILNDNLPLRIFQRAYSILNININ